MNDGTLRWRRLRWQALHGLRHRAVGPLLTGAAMLLLATVTPWWEAAWQHRQAERQRQAAGRAASASHPVQDSGQGRLQAFYATLPVPEELPGVLQALIELADSQGLRFLRGSYRLERDPQAAFSRYRMTLPLRGDPGRIQHLIGSALHAFPTLAVESIRYRRDAADESTLDVSIQWVLFVRATNGAAPNGS